MEERIRVESPGMRRYIVAMSIAVFFAASGHASAAPDTCAVMQQRATALAKPVNDDGTEGATLVSATKKTYWEGPLTYAFERTTTTPPWCGQQVVSLTRKGFSFDRSSSDAFDALGAIFGTAVAGDFARSAYVAATKVADQPRDTPIRWYRGRLYGYETLAGSASLTVLSLAEFSTELARAQRAARSISVIP
jgi:hypothetical protein